MGERVIGGEGKESTTHSQQLPLIRINFWPDILFFSALKVCIVLTFKKIKDISSP